MSTSGHLAATWLPNEPQVLLAVRDITDSDGGFRESVDQIERVLVASGAFIGLVVLERCGAVALPLAGNGGPIHRGTPLTVLSRPANAGTRNIQVVFLRRAALGRMSRIMDFVTEQISTLLAREVRPRASWGGFEPGSGYAVFGREGNHA